MSKLKTLKDISLIEIEQPNSIVCVKELCSVAREWVESYEKDKEIVEKPFYMKYLKDKDALILRNQIICNWIKHFFNLEDD